MPLIWKVRLQAIRFWWILRRAKKLAKKYKREPEYYSVQFRNDYVIKKVKKLLKGTNIDLEVKGFEHIPKTSAIMTPNHSSGFDPLFILAALENPSKATDDKNQLASFVSKKELETSKFKHFMSLLDVAYIDRKKPKESLQVMDEFLNMCKNDRRHAVIFPEGTRSKDGKILDFKTGAFRMAKKTYMPIVPVTINNGFGSTNFKKRKGRLTVEVIFHEPIKPSSVVTMDHTTLKEKVQKIVKQDYKITKEASWSQNEASI